MPAGGLGAGYWVSPDTIIVSVDLGTKLWKVSVNSGHVTTIAISSQNFSNPSPIAGTDYLLGSDENSNILALSHADGSSKVVLPNGGWQPKYVEPGYLLYALQGRLLAIAFDRKTLTTMGSPIPVLGKLKTNGLGYSAVYDIAANGTIIYSSETPEDLVKFVWVNEQGKEIDSLDLPADFYGAFSLSPDGSKLAYGLNGPHADIWIFDLVSGQNQKLTDLGVNQYPIWSSNGLWVTYSSYLDSRWDIYRQGLNSSQQREKLTSSGRLKRPGTWSPDDKLLTFYEVVEGEGNNIFLLSMEDKKVTTPWRNTSAGEQQPRFSKDGKFVSYFVTTSGIYVEPYPATGQRWQITSEGVDQIWSSKGDKIYFAVAGTIRPYSVVELNYDGGYSAGQPKEMFRGPYVDVFDKSFDVSADGKRFLVLKAASGMKRQKHLEVIVNWTEELKRAIKGEKD